MRVRVPVRSSLLVALAIAGLSATACYSGDSNKAAAGPSGAVDGISLRPVSASYHGRELVVTVRVEGRDELGEVVVLFDRPKFSAGQGGVSYASRSWSDQTDPRLIFAAFEISGEPQASAGMFEIAELGFLTSDEATAASKNGTSQPRRVIGGWRVPVQAANTHDRLRTIEMNSVQPLGSGAMRIQRISIASDSITVHGKLEGFSREQIQEIVLAPATLTGAAGDGKFIGGRSGFGPGLADFELTFSKIGGRVQLSIPFNVAGLSAGGRAQNVAAADSLKALAGQVSQFDLSLE